MDAIFKLIYVSEACDKICYSDIQKILESAQRHNHENHITGLMIFKDHHFLQILEGREDDVLNTAGRILRDRRNHHFRVLVESYANKRIFANWSMAFHDGDIDQNNSHLVNELFNAALNHHNKEKEVLLQMLECFRRSCPRFAGTGT